MVSHSFKAADGLRLSPYLEEILFVQVKMQLMINQVHYSSWNTSNLEVLPYLDALQSRLDDIAGVVNGASIAFGNNYKWPKC